MAPPSVNLTGTDEAVSEDLISPPSSDTEQPVSQRSGRQPAPLPSALAVYSQVSEPATDVTESEASSSPLPQRPVQKKPLASARRKPAPVLPSPNFRRQPTVPARPFSGKRMPSSAGESSKQSSGTSDQSSGTADMDYEAQTLKRKQDQRQGDAAKKGKTYLKP